MNDVRSSERMLKWKELRRGGICDSDNRCGPVNGSPPLIWHEHDPGSETNDSRTILWNKGGEVRWMVCYYVMPDLQAGKAIFAASVVRDRKTALLQVFLEAPSEASVNYGDRAPFQPSDAGATLAHRDDDVCRSATGYPLSFQWNGCLRCRAADRLFG